MKLWLKYLIGVLLGIALSFAVPTGSEAASSVLSFITEMIVSFGRYIVVPLVFFTAITAVNKLRESKMILKTGIWTTAVTVVSALLLTFIGLVVILVIRLPRIPITADKAVEAASLNINDLIRALFPSSAFETLMNGTFLFPAFLFACFSGGACTGDQTAFRPIVTLTDALSKLCYNIVTLFTEILSIGMIAVMCSWAIQFRTRYLSRAAVLHLSRSSSVPRALCKPVFRHYRVFQRRYELRTADQYAYG